jgi:hypothetical protein
VSDFEKNCDFKFPAGRETTLGTEYRWCKVAGVLKVVAEKSYRRGRLSTVDLLVLTRLNQLLWILQTLLTFSKNQLFNEEVNCTER